MIDRASIFSDAEILDTLRRDFVCVAVDAWYLNRRQDAEGEFYRKVVKQEPSRQDMNQSTQGKYALDADGRLFGFDNHGSDRVGRVKALIAKARRDYAPSEAVAISPGRLHPWFDRTLREGMVAVDVTARVLDAETREADPRKRMFLASLGRDHLWIRKDEVAALCAGTLPDSLVRRMSRFHLNDFTRGEPDMWAKEDLKKLDLTLKEGRLTGSIHFEIPSGKRGYEARLLGFVEAKDGQLTRFDLVAKGEYWGKGRFVSSSIEGRFPVGVSFRLSDPKAEESKVPPQGSRDLDDYLGP